MVKTYFAACEGQFPQQRGELRRIALALCRGGVDTMEALCALRRSGPGGLLEIRSIGEKRLGLIEAVCARYEENQASSQGGTPLRRTGPCAWGCCRQRHLQQEQIQERQSSL